MKYKSINELSNFEFHDAIIKKINFNGKELILIVSSLNATIQNSKNDFEKDMCIEKANLIFENVNIESIVFSAYKNFDADGNLINSVEAVYVEPKEYKNILKTKDNDYGWFYAMGELLQLSDKTYKVSFDMEGYFVGFYAITFKFSKVTVEWNNFNGEAWYENKKWKKD